MKYLIITTGFAAAVLIGSAANAQRPGPGGPPPPAPPPHFTSDVQQLGYEHGYRDGGDRGRQDRDRGQGRSQRPNDYLDSARYSYQPSFGNRRDYMSGYQNGFQAGYDDGFNYYTRPGRYGQIYGRQSSNRGGSTVQRPPFDSGYSEGVAMGQQDLQRNTRSDYRGSDSYRRGDPQFKDGFERGYQDGYGRDRYQSDGGGYFPNRTNTGPADTRDGVGPTTRTITIPATQQWVSTGIRVNQGDRLRFQSTGEIQIGGANGRASVDGSLSGRHVAGAPIPNVLAGALIGRIDSGQPWGLGDQPMIVAPGSGVLYLGVNDDTLNDNSGQFNVVLSW